MDNYVMFFSIAFLVVLFAVIYAIILQVDLRDKFEQKKIEFSLLSRKLELHIDNFHSYINEISTNMERGSKLRQEIGDSLVELEDRVHTNELIKESDRKTFNDEIKFIKLKLKEETTVLHHQIGVIVNHINENQKPKKVVKKKKLVKKKVK